jgi:hypothetical protein
MESQVKNGNLETVDRHISETECLLEIVIHIAELDDEERARLRPAAVTVLYVMADMLRAARRAATAEFCAV